MGQSAPDIEWENAFNGNRTDLPGKVIATSDGGYLLGGSSESNISVDKSRNSIGDDLWIVKIDSAGIREWDKTYRVNGTDEFSDLLQTNDGGYLIVGDVSPGINNEKTVTLAQNHIWALKVDALGNIEWQQAYGGGDRSIGVNDINASITHGQDGGYLLTAEQDSGDEVWVRKIDDFGNIEWERYMVTTGTKLEPKLLTSPDGGYLLTMHSDGVVTGDKTVSPIGNFDIWVLKLDIDGNILWQKVYGTEENDSQGNPNVVVQYPDGGYLIGSTISGEASGTVSEGPINPAATDDDWWIARLDANGNILWDKRLGGTNGDILFDLLVRPDGAIVAVGESESNASGNKTEDGYGQGDYWIVELDATGNILWDKTIGGTRPDRDPYLTNSPDGGFVVFGQTWSGANEFKSEPYYSINSTFTQGDYWAIKLNCDFTTLDTVPNVISPLSQTACINGQPMTILGSNDDSLSTDLVKYQWQASIDNMTWFDLVNGFGKDFLPEPTAVNTYFRRIVNWDCSKSDTSLVHTLNINSFNAPTADAGILPFAYCPGGSVTIGGSPTATGGTPPYTYAWEPALFLNDSTLANPTATVAATGVFYTLSVVDANGCLDIEQVQLVEARADAGPDDAVCIGNDILLGDLPLVTQPTIEYNWNLISGDGLPTTTNVPQIVVSPTVNSTYELVLTGPDGCPSRDTVNIAVIPVPIADAGPDPTICEGTLETIGTAGSVGNEYFWRTLDDDNTFLDNNLLDQPTYDRRICPPGATTTYLLSVIDTAYKCAVDYDTLTVTVIRAEAGDPDPRCSPTFLGDPKPVSIYDYQWTVISGDSGSITPGTETDARIYVSPAVATNYRLGVSANGQTCFDSIQVDLCAGTGACVNDSIAFRMAGVCDGTELLQTLPQSIGAYVDTTVMQVRWEGDSLHLLSATNVGSVQVIDTVRTDLRFDRIISDLNGVDLCTLKYLVLAGTFTPIEFNPTPAVICANDPSGVMIGDVAVAGFTYSWSPSEGLNNPNISNPIATPSTTTIYRVSIRDNLTGCEESFTNTVTVIPNTSIDVGPDRFFCDGAILSFGPVPHPAFAYSWEPGIGLADPNQAIQTDTFFAPLTFVLTAVDTVSGLSCSVTDTLMFMESPGLTADAGSDDTYCPVNPMGIQIGTTDSTAFGYDYLWLPAEGLNDPTSPTPIATPDETTTYTLIVSDDDIGCDATANVTITVTSPGTLGLSNLDDVDLCPSNSVQIGPTPVVGYTYAWLPTDGLSCSDCAQPMASPEETTTYTLTVTDTANCLIQTLEMSVNLTPPGDLGLASLPDEDICVGDSVQIGPAPVAGYTYEWLLADSLSCSDCAQPQAKPIDTTIYTLVVLDTMNCLSDTLSLAVNVEPYSGITLSSVTICEGEEIPLSVPQTPGYTYTWSPNINLSCTVCTETLVSPTTTTTYYVDITGGQCNTRDSITVNVIAGSADAEPDQTVCAAPVTIGTPAVGGFIYNWEPSAGLSSTTVAEPTALPADTTDYILTMVNTSNGCQFKDTVQVAPAFDLNPVDLISLCPEQYTTIGVAPIVGFTYSWSPTTDLDDPNIANPMVSPTASRTYTLTVDDGAGCTRTTNVQVDVLTPAEFSLTGPGLLCQNDCDTLTATVQSGNLTTFSWSPATGLTSPTELSTVVCPTETTTYTFIAQDDQGCIISEDILVTVAPFPTPTADAGPDTVLCTGESIVLGTAAQNGLTYNWSPVAGLSPNAYVAQPTFSPVTNDGSFTIQLTVVDTSTYCSNTDEVTVTFQELSVEAGPNETFCLGDSVTLNPVVTGALGGLSYSWSPATGLSCSDCANPKAAPSSNTTYLLTVTDSLSNCTASDLVFISTSGVPNPSVDLDDIVFCSENQEITIDLTPVSGYSYSWVLAGASGVTLTGNTLPNPTINTGTDGDFQAILTINDTTQLQCNTTVETVNFSLGTPPDVPLSDVVLCPGETSATIGPDPADVSGLYSYEWIPSTSLSAGNIANPIATVTSDMTYLVNIEYINPIGIRYEGCNLTTNVAVSRIEEVIINAGEDVAFCAADQPALQIGTPAFYPNILVPSQIYFNNVGRRSDGADSGIFSMPADGSAPPNTTV